MTPPQIPASGTTALGSCCVSLLLTGCPGLTIGTGLGLFGRRTRGGGPDHGPDMFVRRGHQFSFEPGPFKASFNPQNPVRLAFGALHDPNLGSTRFQCDMGANPPHARTILGRSGVEAALWR